MALKVIIRRMFPYEGESNTKAFFDIKIQVGRRVFGFNDLKLMKNRESGELFVSHPAKPGSEEGTFFEYSYTDNTTKGEIHRAALGAYRKALKDKEQTKAATSAG